MADDYRIIQVELGEWVLIRDEEYGGSYTTAATNVAITGSLTTQQGGESNRG